MAWHKACQISQSSVFGTDQAVPLVYHAAMEPIQISLESAIALTDLSRRTWWRYISEGRVTRVADDGRGRAMLNWADVLPLICLPLDAEELALTFSADAGDAQAQNDLGQLLLSAGKFKCALYWLDQAAKKNNADAMQWLGYCYFNGQGVPQDDNLGLMWTAKAAAHGHVIAQAQVRGLWSQSQTADSLSA
jgi:TPR repeat protein